MILVVLAALAGLGLASALWGGGWVWPHGTETITRVLDGLLHGQPGRGLPPEQLRRVARPVPTYACIALAEATLLAAAVAVGICIARFRPRGNGMASRNEAEQALGIRQLRAARSVIRPDRYRPEAAHGRRRAGR
ncbi:conjugal transfer protein [Modestobacter altitudinis]|uniref:conjugal transfer protein n=1 Tax=Modestobacter altitudinis TaxID=2213158 RepID=UPI001FE36CC3|nr:conjugal transfer protein [Modestobacter altitudinis]